MQPVKRQLEAALAEVERSSRSGGYDAMRRYLQLVDDAAAQACIQDEDFWVGPDQPP